MPHCSVSGNLVLLFVLCLLQGKPPDWQDFVGIITLLVINSTISFIEENNAGNAAAALMARLAPKAKVYRFLFLFGFYIESLGGTVLIGVFRIFFAELIEI